MTATLFMIGAVCGYLAMIVFEYTATQLRVRRAYRRGCRDGLRRGKNRGYRNAMADNADLLSEAEFLIEQIEKEDSMWASHVQAGDKVPAWDPWYRSDN